LFISIEAIESMSAQPEAGTPFKSWMCLVCGWIYNEEDGSPEEGIAAGTRWEDVPPNWTCPECGARKEDFEMVQI
jgi:rubredoxin